MAYNALNNLNSPQPDKDAKPRAQPQRTQGFNSKPDQDANAGQSPAMMGDKQKIARPSAPRIAPSTAPAIAAGAPTQASGLDAAMSAMADTLHPRKR